MVNPDEERGNAKPHQDGADQSDGYDNQSLGQIRRRVWRALSWPQRWWRGGDHNRRTANATVLLAVGTLALAIVNLGMLSEMRQGARGQHDDTILALGRTDQAITATNRLGDEMLRTAVESHRLADAAKTSADISDRADRLSRRAWISPSEAVLATPLPSSNDIFVRVAFSNSGREPAVGVAFNKRTFELRLDQPWRSPRKPNALLPQDAYILGKNDTCDDAAVTAGGNVIYPSPRSNTDSVSFFIVPDNKDDILRKRVASFFHACFSYITLGVVHHSRFCNYLIVDDNGTNGKFAICPSGNDAD